MGRPPRTAGRTGQALRIAHLDEHAELWQGEALAVLAEMPAGSVDAVITDPPYSTGGMVRSDRTRDVHRKYAMTETAMAYGAFTGDNRDQRSYGYWCALWLSECLRIVRPGGVAAIFTDWRQLPTTTDALQAGGFVWRGVIPWAKPGCRPQAGRFAAECEFVVWGSSA
jgi:site-specific DNA-methyltransferase (adenine-specific)